MYYKTPFYVSVYPERKETTSNDEPVFFLEVIMFSLVYENSCVNHFVSFCYNILFLGNLFFYKIFD